MAARMAIPKISLTHLRENIGLIFRRVKGGEIYAITYHNTVYGILIALPTDKGDVEAVAEVLEGLLDGR